MSTGSDDMGKRAMNSRKLGHSRSLHSLRFFLHFSTHFQSRNCETCSFFVDLISQQKKIQVSQVSIMLSSTVYVFICIWSKEYETNKNLATASSFKWRFYMTENGAFYFSKKCHTAVNIYLFESDLFGFSHEVFGAAPINRKLQMFT